MQSTHRFKLGLFVCFAIFLLTGLLIFLGLLDQFNDKAIVTTFFSESVQGLTKGSGVKFMGVPIGQVHDITFEAESRLIRVDMEIDLSKIHVRDSSQASSRFHGMNTREFYEVAYRAIDEDGLCAKLESEGITGVKYIQLNYRPDKKTPQPYASGWNKELDLFYIPSEPSLMKNLETSITGILDKLNAVDYVGLAKRIEGTLDRADKTLTDPKLTNIIKNIDTASGELVVTTKTLNKSLSPEQVKEVVAKYDKTMTAIQDLANTADKKLQASEIDKTSEKLRESLDSFRNTNKHFVDALGRINEGMDAMIELIQMLDNDPSSVIHGKHAGQDNRSFRKAKQ